MTTQIEAVPANAQECQPCKGTGVVAVWIEWSDGLGGGAATCELCDGTGYIVGSHLDLLYRYKRQARDLGGELDALKKHVALYLSLVETGQLPSPPLRDASAPSPYIETWAEYLHKAIANLPRLTPAETCPGCGRSAAVSDLGGLCPNCYHRR